MIYRSKNLNWSIPVISGALSFLFCCLGLSFFFTYRYFDHTDPSNMPWNFLVSADVLVAWFIGICSGFLFAFKGTNLKGL